MGDFQVPDRDVSSSTTTMSPERVVTATLSPAEEADWGRAGTGVERPEALPPSRPRPYVDRTFAFIDLSSFTAFCESRGEHAAVELLTRFRAEIADVAARRGVRIAKWLGDGAMLVGVRTGPVIATAAEVLGRFDLTDLRVSAGIAGGPVILFGGDDYIGRSANLASRLCDVADPGEILVEVSIADQAPDWVEVRDSRTVTVRGVGEQAAVVLGLHPEVHLPGAPARTTAGPTT